MKVKGALWKQFYNDEEFWGSRWHDDTLILFDGVEQEEYDNPADDAVVDVQAGDVYFEAEGFQLADRDTSLEAFYRRWLKIQTTEVLIVTVEKSQAASVKAEIKNITGVKGVK